MAPPKGHGRYGGREKGTPNKAGRSVKAIFENVFHLLQEDEQANLYAWAKSDPKEYYKLAKHLVPAAVEAKIEGDMTLTHKHSVSDTDHAALARYYAEQKALTKD
jgi:hypothetical protein